MSMLVHRSANGPETLSTRALCLELAELARQERQTEWLLCRHLAELAERCERRDPELDAYADVYQLARLRFGMGVRKTRERVRIGRALRELPHIEAAFVEGAVGYARVREVTRVATPESEGAWLQAAQELPLRVLERRVAEAGGDGERDKTSEPAQVRWTSPASLEVRLTLPAETWAMLQRAMEGARRTSEAPLSDAAALEAVARDALARQSDGEDTGDMRNLLVLYRCHSCERTELETGAGPIELDAAAAERLACGSKRCALEHEGRTVSTGGALPSPVRRAVMLRDRMRCRTPGCRRRRYVDVHHIEAREHGGVHSRSNCLCLCTSCHERVHAGKLRIEGDAEGELRFYDGSGERLDEGDVTPGGFLCSAEAERVLALMRGRGGWHPDRISDESGLDIGEVTRALLQLELAGRVRGPGCPPAPAPPAPSPDERSSPSATRNFTHRRRLEALTSC